jgi:D-alanyl-D-alanine carboxypeptidase/D-alanyl-D-alanine-endopeptidase (penicillin-binding protein 4)
MCHDRYLYCMHRRKIIVCFLLFVLTGSGISQTISQKLAGAVQQMEADPQLRHAIVSLCVADAQTGKTVYAHHAQMGLAPASSQKIFTSVAAFDLLGKDYRYTTQLAYQGKIEHGVLGGKILIIGSGDPTLGSWRYNGTKGDDILDKWVSDIKKMKIKKVQGGVWGHFIKGEWSMSLIPDGWIWQDIGNYYGAGSDVLNWHENQYDMTLRPGKVAGDSVTLVATDPKLYDVHLDLEELTTGAKGSGDNAYIYLPPGADWGYVKGTIPTGVNTFTISGSIPRPTYQLGRSLTEKLQSLGIDVTTSNMQDGQVTFSPSEPTTISSHVSPPLDSIVYWFLKKSINLYGEALIKTMALKKTGAASTEKGVELLRNFWSERGIDKGALQIMDGSGLSPQNRVTTDAQVKALQYARTKPWFNAFYHAMPEYNGMKMKSGSIGGARAYAGYHTAKDGTQYVFSIIVNNYDGSAGEVVKKMYKVLDVLK